MACSVLGTGEEADVKIERVRIKRWPACFLGGLGLLIVGCIAGKPLSIPPPPTDPKQLSILESGIAAYDEGKHDQAIKIFQGLIAHYPGSSLLMEAQWMLGRTYEQRGDWRRALLEYESLLSNFPQNPHRSEAGLRVRFLSELLYQEAGKKSYPVIRGLEIADQQVLPSQLAAYLAQGFNTIVVGADISERAPLTQTAAEMVSSAHRAGFYVFARLKIRPMNLFEPAAQTQLKRTLIEIAVSGMDGVVLDGFVTLAEEGLPRTTVEQFNSDFKLNLEPKDIFENPSAYWQWAGWRSRKLMKILSEAVKPVLATRSRFYWGIVFPSGAIAVPHQVMAQTGLDLLEAKQQGLDYFGISAVEDRPAHILLEKARDLIGDPTRMVVIVNASLSEALRQQPFRPSDDGILYFNAHPSSSLPVGRQGPP